MEVHPYAKLFPEMAPEEIRELAEDIRKHGQRHKIIVDVDGRLIDGRNRLKACGIAGKTPETEPFDGDDEAILELVISLNVNRRHLTESQRAMVAAEITTLTDGRPKKTEPIGSVSPQVSVPQAAAMMGVGNKSVTRARKVKENATPSVQRAVANGKVSVTKAAAIADLPRPEQPAALKEAIAHPRRISGGTKFDPEELEDGPDRENPITAERRIANNLLTKLAGDFTRSRDALGPLVCAFDEIKASDPTFARRHKELLGHHSRLFQVMEDGAGIVKALRAAWERK